MEKSPYTNLAERLDMNLQGVPKKEGEFSPAFLEYLELLFTAEEAELASFLNVGSRLISAQEVAQKAGRPVEEVHEVLDRLMAKRSVVGASESYALPAIGLVVNYHQLLEETGEDDIRGGELYQQFFIEDGFYRFYESSAAGTPLRKAIPVEQSIASEQKVLSHEEMDDVLDKASQGLLALIPCPCRVRTEKLGIRECKDKFPVTSCLMLGIAAMASIDRGEGKKVSKEEAKKYIEETREIGLVMMVDNYAEFTDGIICFCCECCCSFTRGLTRWDNPRAFARSDFVARVGDECAACGTCVDRCMFHAISLAEDADSAAVDGDRCMGCGVCTVTCPTESLKLYRLERESVYTTRGELWKKVARENQAVGQSRPRQE